MGGGGPRGGGAAGGEQTHYNHKEGGEHPPRRIERAERRLGAGRVKYVHPDCGFWMLKRSIADRKIEALARGRDLYLGR